MRKILAAALAAFLVAGCSPQAEGPRLEIISPHWQGIEDAFGPAFEKHWREKTGGGIEVVWRDMGGTSDDLRYIKSEFQKRGGGIDIDVFFGGGIDPYRQLKDLDLLEKCDVPDETLSAIPADLNGVPLYDPDGTWFGTAISGFGIVFNKQIVAKLGVDAPATWEDLADPELFTWVGTGDPRHSGTVHMMYEIILQAYGWERGWQIITAMAANTRNMVTNSGDIPLSVANGQIAAGTAIDFYAWTQVEQVGADRVGFVLPEGLTVINPDSVGVLKDAPNPEAAKEFVRFVLSEEGQKLWYLAAGAEGGPVKDSLLRMPVRKDLYERYGEESPVKMNPFAQSRGFRYDSKLGTSRYEALNDLVGATIVDCHDDLVEAWGAAVKAGNTADVLVELAVTPVSEEELTALAGGELADPIARNEKIGEWVRFARGKYERLSP